jgi:hypothetical protein
MRVGVVPSHTKLPGAISVLVASGLALVLLAVVGGRAVLEVRPRVTQPAPFPRVHVGLPETIPLRSQSVDSVAASPEGIWVSTMSVGNTPTPLLMRLDPRTGEVLNRLETRTHIGGLVAGEGLIWGLGGERSDELVRIDPRTGALEYVRSGVAGPIEVADDSVWVMKGGPTEGPYVLLRLNPATGATEAQITLPAAPWASATDGRSLWLSPVHPADRSIIHVDASTNRVVGQVSVAVSGTVGNIVAAADRAWVFVIDRDSTVVEIDSKAATTRAQDVSGELTSTTLAAAHGRVWFLSESGSLDAIDAENLESDQSSDVEWDVWPSSAKINPTATLDPNTGDIWVGNYEGSVTHIPIDEITSPG